MGLIMLQNFLLQRKVTPRVLTLAVAISLFTGLGAGLSVDMLSNEGPIVLPSETRAGEGIGSSTNRRLPDFVALAKRLQPVVVNVSASKRSDGLKGFGGPAEKGTPFKNDFWGDYFGVPAPPGSAQQRSVGVRLPPRVRRYHPDQLPCGRKSGGYFGQAFRQKGIRRESAREGSENGYCDCKS